MVSLKNWQKVIHSLAISKGWWDAPIRTPLEIHMLIVSEVAEATEEIRTHGDKYYETYVGQSEPKPCGEAVELTDAVIRIMDYFEYKGWNLEEFIKVKHKYNKTRSYRHGGKSA